MAAKLNPVAAYDPCAALLHNLKLHRFPPVTTQALGELRLTQQEREHVLACYRMSQAPPQRGRVSIGTSQTLKAGPSFWRRLATTFWNAGPRSFSTSRLGRSPAGMSAATRTRTMRSGSLGGSPTFTARTTSSPCTTRPQTA